MNLKTIILQEKKPDRKEQMLYDFIYIKFFKNAKLHGQKTD